MASPMKMPKPWESLVESFGDLTKSTELDEFNLKDLLRAGAFAAKQMQQQLDLSRLFQPQYMEAEQEGISGRLQSIMDLMRRFARPMREADESANPERTAMLRELEAQTMGDLQAQGRLTPEALRWQEQDVRRGQQARGLTQGSGPMSDEVRRTTQERERARSKSQLAAGQFLSNQYQRPMDTSQMIAGQGRSTPNIISPTSSSRMSAAELYPGLADATFTTNTNQAVHNYNVKQGNKAAKAARRAKMIGVAGNMIMPGMGNIMGDIAGGGNSSGFGGGGGGGNFDYEKFRDMFLGQTA